MKTTNIKNKAQKLEKKIINKGEDLNKKVKKEITKEKVKMEVQAKEVAHNLGEKMKEGAGHLLDKAEKIGKEAFKEGKILAGKGVDYIKKEGPVLAHKAMEEAKKDYKYVKGKAKKVVKKVEDKV